MRTGSHAVAVLVLALEACTSTYFVHPKQLEAGRELQRGGLLDVAVPAVAENGRRTNVRLLTVEGTLRQGEVERVILDDWRPGARITGYVFLGLAVPQFIAGAVISARSDEGVTNTVKTNFIFGAVLAAIGLGLTLGGHLALGPEAEYPSRGLPPTVTLGGTPTGGELTVQW